ncbi:hypothetical protein B0T24DRAFT_622040 [Lasiosphaeria ovina]|uniref:Uncharacterized protein n=1 Tax=Lasiosphaeria ovina TaxID=92902 RepID=A0AAE0KBH1_9PEZI|nr:hypothetical protein B0T24DRAFT_622040 [Lasiosphaeria ovina]
MNKCLENKDGKLKKKKNGNLGGECGACTVSDSPGRMECACPNKIGKNQMSSILLNTFLDVDNQGRLKCSGGTGDIVNERPRE